MSKRLQEAIEKNKTNAEGKYDSKGKHETQYPLSFSLCPDSYSLFSAPVCCFCGLTHLVYFGFVKVHTFYPPT